MGQVVGVDELLAEARAGLDRLDPFEARREMSKGAALVDIRSIAQIEADGRIPSAHAIERNVLEWRLDPECPHAIASLARSGARIVVICNEGYQSSLAAANLRRLGLDATDLQGGFQAWRKAGLPIEG